MSIAGAQQFHKFVWSVFNAKMGKFEPVQFLQSLKLCTFKRTTALTTVGCINCWVYLSKTFQHCNKVIQNDNVYTIVLDHIFIVVQWRVSPCRLYAATKGYRPCHL